MANADLICFKNFILIHTIFILAISYYCNENNSIMFAIYWTQFYFHCLMFAEMCIYFEECHYRMWPPMIVPDFMIAVALISYATWCFTQVHYLVLWSEVEATWTDFAYCMLIFGLMTTLVLILSAYIYGMLVGIIASTFLGFFVPGDSNSYCIDIKAKPEIVILCIPNWNQVRIINRQGLENLLQEFDLFYFAIGRVTEMRFLPQWVIRCLNISEAAAG